ncbi:hypothetical protein FOPG_14508 [Fusarium oxysporum f. sp. conglutinans race 2 54008]|uniref:Uncharacterized protein n=1 Tax=Fusarium oxysporum f. sp. conglutinans race 2 54008 TaxID=1089457 RepID=X0H1K2_FUSOX|nr:hypothetical protein FOPG_14508 [Fusarium oxysporum f. sp. conglutinans race 2 54008]
MDSVPKFGGNGEIEAGEVKQYAESIPTICPDIEENFHFAEGEQDAESVTTISTEIQEEPDFMKANHDAENICREVQNRAEEHDFTGTEKGADKEGNSERDKIMAWMENAEDVTNEIVKVRFVR